MQQKRGLSSPAPKPIAQKAVSTAPLMHSQGITEMFERASVIADQLAPDEVTNEVIDRPSVALDPQIKPVFRYYGHRSGHEELWRCPRAHYLHYHHLGTGIYHQPQKLHLEVGSAVHFGLALILKTNDINHAVEGALDYMMRSEPWMLLKERERLEQATLIEGLLRSFWYFLWPKMRESFDVLFVERGVVEVVTEDFTPNYLFDAGTTRINIVRMSRPDAILQDRTTKEVVGVSWKTINDLTEWRRTQFHNDLQGLMEMHFGEKLFAQLHETGAEEFIYQSTSGKLPTLAELRERIKLWDAMPKEIDYIQTVFLVKGVRKPITELDGASITDMGDEIEGVEYIQNSPLCYQWTNLQGTTGEYAPLKSWAYRYYKPNNVTYNNLSSKIFARQPILEAHPSVDHWVQLLNSGKVFPSTVKDERNLRNPLSAVAVYDEPLYRNREQMVSMNNQVLARQKHVARALYQIDRAVKQENRSLALELIDEHFDQQLTSCRQPYRCEFQKVCHESGPGPLDLNSIPPEYGVRVPHHEAERVGRSGEDEWK